MADTGTVIRHRHQRTSRRAATAVPPRGRHHRGRRRTPGRTEDSQIIRLRAARRGLKRATRRLRRGLLTLAAGGSLGGLLLLGGLLPAPTSLILMIVAAVAVAGAYLFAGAGRRRAIGRVITSGVVGLSLVIGIAEGPSIAEDLWRRIHSGAPVPTVGCSPLTTQPQDVSRITSLDRSANPAFTFGTGQVIYSLESVRDQLYLTATGTINGRLRPGNELYLLGRAGIGDTDSFGNRVDHERFFPAQRLTTGCWTLHRRAIGYPGFCGVTLVHLIGVVPEATANRLDDYSARHALDAWEPNHGIGPRLLRDWSLEPIAWWSMPTLGSPACSN